MPWTGRDRGLRVAVAAPTNEQAFGLVRKISDQHMPSRGEGRTVAFVPAQKVEIPDQIRDLPGDREVRPASHARGEGLVVGTIAKLGSAGRDDLGPFDVLVIDESYQANSAAYFAIGGLAPIHLLVGDGGRDPARSQRSTTRPVGKGCRRNPLQTAVGVLRL